MYYDLCYLHILYYTDDGEFSASTCKENVTSNFNIFSLRILCHKNFNSRNIHITDRQHSHNVSTACSQQQTNSNNLFVMIAEFAYGNVFTYMILSSTCIFSMIFVTLLENSYQSYNISKLSFQKLNKYHNMYHNNIYYTKNYINYNL